MNHHDCCATHYPMEVTLQSPSSYEHTQAICHSIYQAGFGCISVCLCVTIFLFTPSDQAVQGKEQGYMGGNQHESQEPTMLGAYPGSGTTCPEELGEVSTPLPPIVRLVSPVQFPKPTCSEERTPPPPTPHTCFLTRSQVEH